MKTGKDDVGGYRVIRPLASGEYGCVVLVSVDQLFVGACVRPPRPVALKIVCVNPQDPSTWTDTEYAILSAFRLGSVPHTVHAVGRVTRLTELPRVLETAMQQRPPGRKSPTKVAYDIIAMRYAPGPTLREYLSACATAQVSTPFVLGWYQCARQLCAFSYHAFGAFRVGHGDLKLGNIVVESNGGGGGGRSLSVVDLSFGTRHSTAAAADGSSVVVAWQRGTMCYMPPERLFFAARPAWVDDSSAASGDLWAIGTIMSTVALTGHRFPDMDEMQQLCVLDNAGRFNPRETDTVYHLLSTATMPWFHSLVSVIATDSNLPQPFVEHAVRLILWTAALERECAEEAEGLCCVTVQHAAVRDSARYQSLSFYLDHIYSDYAKYGRGIYECAIVTLRAQLGKAFRLYLMTQQWHPRDRWTTVLGDGDNPFASMYVALDGTPKSEHACTVDWDILKDAALRSDEANLSSLFSGLSSHFCTHCGARATGRTHNFCGVCSVKRAKT